MFFRVTTIQIIYKGDCMDISSFVLYPRLFSIGVFFQKNKMKIIVYIDHSGERFDLIGTVTVKPVLFRMHAVYFSPSAVIIYSRISRQYSKYQLHSGTTTYTCGIFRQMIASVRCDFK